jgi:gliding motility-associated-like protein
MIQFFYKTPGIRFLLLFGVFCFSNFSAQVNIVPNPSFEDTIAIPKSCGELYKSQNWYSPGNRTPDYFSVFSPTVSGPCDVKAPKSCLGYQMPRTGNFYSGIIIRTIYLPTSGFPTYSNYCEFLSVKLTQPLIPNRIYKFNMYYSLADGSGISTNQLSAYFSNTPFNSGTFLPSDTGYYFNYIKPHINHDPTFILDTSNWIGLSGCFLAQGGEEYLTIGNFKDGINSPTTTVTSGFLPCPGNAMDRTSYIFIDDVSLYDMGYYNGPASCKNDTLVCNGTSLLIGNNIKDSSLISWNPTTALSCTNCVNPIASPTITTLYYLNKSICGANSKDSMLIQVHTSTITANAGNNRTICFGESTQIGVLDSTNFTSYSWQLNGTLSCTNCAMPIANPTVSTTYTVQRTECASITMDTVRVIVDDCDPTYTVPNVFTPNYDDVNDTWGINFSTVNSHITDFKMSIYDRWGLEVYSTNSELSTPNSKWDGHTTSGEECSAGVYFYIIAFGKNGERVLLKGHVSLFR